MNGIRISDELLFLVVILMVIGVAPGRFVFLYHLEVHRVGSVVNTFLLCQVLDNDTVGVLIGIGLKESAFFRIIVRSKGQETARHLRIGHDDALGYHEHGVGMVDIAIHIP